MEKYEDLRAEAIKAFRATYKDSLAFDLIGADKSLRTRLTSDPIYLRETRKERAKLFVKQLQELDDVIDDSFASDLKPSGKLKAIDMRKNLLLSDVDEGGDESNALNVVYIAMTREDFEAMDNVEIFEGNGSTNLSAAFGEGEAVDSAETRAKEDIARRMREQNGDTEKTS